MDAESWLLNKSRLVDNVDFVDSHVLCHIWARKSNWKVISLTLKVISFFFFWQILASETFFDKKNQDITKKKKISRHISFDFLGQNPHILSGKRLPQTAKNGVQRKASFFEWTFWKLMVTLVGYFRKKTGQIYFLQKICKKKSVPVEIQKKKCWFGTTFLLNLGKKARDQCNFSLIVK